MNGVHLALGAAAILAAAASRRGSRAVLRLYHGTSPGAVRAILRQGFKGSDRPYDLTLDNAVSAYELASQQAAEGRLDIEQDVLFELYERSGVPMPGRVYLARDLRDVITREGPEDDGSWIFIVEVDPDDMWPDEDWFGGLLGARILISATEDKKLADAILSLMTEEFSEQVLSLSRWVNVTDYWVGTSLVGKAAIEQLATTWHGKQLLREAAKISPKVSALPDAVKIVELLRDGEPTLQQQAPPQGSRPRRGSLSALYSGASPRRGTP